VRVLLDTHAVLWAADNDTRLGTEAAALLGGCQPGDAVISDLTLLEVAMLVKKGRVSMSIPLRDYLRGLQSNYPVLAINAEIAAAAMDLTLPGAGPFDRVIVATALHHDLPLATRDRAITEAQVVRTVW
jgi:PIN domain nuclease of toxin-antitoxin system